MFPFYQMIDFVQELWAAIGYMASSWVWCANRDMWWWHSVEAHIHRVSEKQLDPLLFHHIFALTTTNCMKIFRST